jgi:hypothetical protein
MPEFQLEPPWQNHPPVSSHSPAHTSAGRFVVRSSDEIAAIEAALSNLIAALPFH